MAAPKKIDTRQLILDTTEQLIEERQVEAVSLQDIAAKAGISKGTLYYYYTSKQLVLLDLVERYIKNLANDYIKWIEDKEKDTSIKRLIYYVLERGARSKRAKLHIYLINHALRDDRNEVRGKFKELYRNWSDMLRKSIEERIDSEDAAMVADVLLMMIDGILIREMMDDKRYDLMKISELLINKINK
ncbi:MAG: TetR/AcrR family transcriptional regulator [Christensenellales bacterium]|jgi:AcrR family transcriptional regulator